MLRREYYSDSIDGFINTSSDEEGVFMHPDGKTLYFSSKGHNTMGGYDIFKSVYEDGKWSAPENIGYPINTPDNDIFFAGVTSNTGFLILMPSGATCSLPI